MKFFSLKVFSVFAVVALCTTSMTHGQMQTPAAQQDLASAEVIAVYPKEKRVLLKHGPIANLGMSDMTMEFRVPSPRMLASFKRGKKVRFSAVMVKDDYIVTHVEPAK